MKKVIARKCDDAKVGRHFDAILTIQRNSYIHKEVLNIRKTKNNQGNEFLKKMYQSNDLSEVIHYARLLSLLGDPRLNPGEIPNMVFIKGGEAKIGIDEQDIQKIVEKYSCVGVLEEWIMKETPKHLRTIDDFWMSIYPVTNLEYYLFLLENYDAEVPSSWTFGSFPIEKSNHPVYSIGFESALKYCSWLSKKTGKTFSLPTEFEWEWAAGQSLREYPWGDTYSPEYANTAELGIMSTTPVGCFKLGATPNGIYDLAGNVEELTISDYHPYPEGKFIVDDLVTNDGYRYKITKGGCFSRFSDLCRVSRRHGVKSSDGVDRYAVGFRIIMK
ncbi:SUMF1/EgtB/PvdO family nonheme iron enzyme [Pelistega sp. MC2]|uniref:formylglycine-generating enzyme family protein n=1 Tax=Pelistega sp. MC2 TaxID=1720297 RepID=UPI0008D962A4|nr:SUMF1/EgtB/PvdO family nonheme iron enzyme [Pelistega sp. MC2]